MDPRPASSRVELRPFEESDWPLVWLWAKQCWNQVADDHTPRDPHTFIEVKRLQAAIKLGVWRDGELGGIFIGQPVTPILCLGHCLFRKGIDRRDSFWGHNTTVPALQQAQEFAWRMGYYKIECHVYQDNAAMLGLLRTVGGIREGLLLNHAMRQGELVNMECWALLKPGT